MTNKHLPDALEKRDIVYGDDPSESELKDLGDRYYDEGYVVDALHAYEEADLREGGEKILKSAVEQGDYFLVQRINYRWSDLVDEETWKQAADNARENGRLTDAVKLYYAGGFEEEVEETEEQLEEEFETSVPAVVRRDIADAKEKDDVDG